MINIQENVTISDEQKNEIISACANELQNIDQSNDVQRTISYVRTMSLLVDQSLNLLRDENASNFFARISDTHLKQKLERWRRLYLQNAEIYETDLKLRIGLISSSEGLFSLAKNLLESCGVNNEELDFLKTLLRGRGMPSTRMESILYVITE